MLAAGSCCFKLLCEHHKHYNAVCSNALEYAHRAVASGGGVPVAISLLALLKAAGKEDSSFMNCDTSVPAR